MRRGETGGPLKLGADSAMFGVGPIRPARPTRGSITGDALRDGSVTNADLSTDAPRRHMRAAAWSGKGSSSTDGAFASYTWAPSADGSGNESFTLGVNALCRVTPANEIYLLGRNVTGYAQIRVGVADASGKGDIKLYNNTTLLLTATDAFDYRGGVHAISCAITNTTAALTVNDAVVASATFASVSWDNTGALQRLGSNGDSATNRWPGALWNARFIDNNNANNNALLTLDEPMPSATYANAYRTATDALYNASGTAAVTASKNTGQGAPWTCAVVSTDGRGMPWQMGSGGAVLYSAFASADLTSVAAAQDVTTFFNTEVSDPTGSLANGVFTFPCAGVVVATWSQALTATAGTADDLALGFKLDGTLGDRYVWCYLGATDVKRTSSACVVIAGTAGQTVTPNISGFSTVTATLEDHAQLVYVFTPTPVAS